MLGDLVPVVQFSGCHAHHELDWPVLARPGQPPTVEAKEHPRRLFPPNSARFRTNVGGGTGAIIRANG